MISLKDPGLLFVSFYAPGPFDVVVLSSKQPQVAPDTTASLAEQSRTVEIHPHLFLQCKSPLSPYVPTDLI